MFANAKIENIQDGGRNKIIYRLPKKARQCFCSINRNARCKSIKLIADQALVRSPAGITFKSNEENSAHLM
jgi:hypothetical protein